MKIEKGRVVEIHYTLTAEDGAVIDSSKGGDPLPYLHGVGNLIPGLEAELEGCVAGDALQVKVPPEQGYGVRSEEQVRVVPRSDLPPGDLKVGTQFQTRGPAGSGLVRVSAIDGDAITLDANHPLAGMVLSFDVQIVTVRAATDEEVEHGHVHGPGGHGH
jgi:FKBP-type peptidyl-prolyl cis-trans isomerase SlyD